MNLVGSLFRSSIGRKMLMAVTGVILIGFVIGHLVGNLQVFQSPDHINGYAVFLRSLGPTLWIARIVLLASAVIHIWAATALTLENARARGSEPYGVKHTIRATLASRTMRITGYVVLAFLIYHLAHFTWGAAQKETFKANLPEWKMTEDYRVFGFVAVKKDTMVEDVHTMVIKGFQPPVISLLYVIAVGLLSFHLLHGADSMFQTFGLRSHKWAPALRAIVIIFCAAYFFFNLTIPGSVLAGRLQPHAAQTASR